MALSDVMGAQPQSYSEWIAQLDERLARVEGRLVELGRVDQRVEQIGRRVACGRVPRGPLPAPRRAQAMEEIRALLAGGPRLAAEVVGILRRSRGYAPETVRAAAERLGVRWWKEKRWQGRGWWELRGAGQGARAPEGDARG